MFIHLAAAAPGTRRGWTTRAMCGLPWRKRADDTAEVAAFLRGATSEVLPGRTICPVCALQAADHLTADGATPAHSRR